MKHLLLFVAIVAALVITAGARAPAASAPTSSASQGGPSAAHYYLSLGDSLAQGHQPIGGTRSSTVIPTGYNPGYADQLFKLERDKYTQLAAFTGDFPRFAATRLGSSTVSATGQSRHGRHTMKAPLALATAVLGAASFAVPALANVPAPIRPDDRAGIRGASSSAADPVPSISVRPDDRAGIRGPGSANADAVSNNGHLRPDDRAGFRGTGPVSAPTATPAVVHVTPSGFDWGDAGIGAAAGAGLILLVLGASLLVRHARTEPRPAGHAWWP
jgi:hypothetical protein